MTFKVYQFADFLLNAQTRSLLHKSEPVPISSRAFEILAYLIERGGEIVEKQELLEKVWAGSFVEEANLPVHISALRRVLREEKGAHKFIRTISGRGYSFVAPVKKFDNRESPVRRSDFSAEYSNSFSPIDSVAVLPFVFDQRKAENEYLASGITQSLINDLSRVDGLKVLSYSAVKKYQGSETSLREIGFLLDAKRILIGRISEFKESLEIVVELINAEDESIIWGMEEVFGLDDLFVIKREISRTLSQKLKLKFNQKNALSKAIAAEAQKLYYRGKVVLESRGNKSNLEETLRQALKFFEEAVEIEPDYSLAHTGIGSVYASLYNHTLLSGEQAAPKIAAALSRALIADPELSEAYILKGSFETMFEHNLFEAEKSLNKAIELNPNNPDAYHWKGLICLFSGRYSEALESQIRATQLDPVSMRFNEQLTRIFYYSGDFEKAIVQAEEMLEFNGKTISSFLFLALSCAHLNRFDAALHHIKKAARIRNLSELFFMEAYIRGLAGDRNAAEKIVARTLHDFPAAQINYLDAAVVYASFNDNEKAFEYIEKAVARRPAFLCVLKSDFRYAGLRNDQRFDAVLKKLNLL